MPETANNRYNADGCIEAADDPEHVVTRHSLCPLDKGGLKRGLFDSFWNDDNLAALFKDVAQPGMTNAPPSILEIVASHLDVKNLSEETANGFLRLSDDGVPPLGPWQVQDGDGMVHIIGVGAAVAPKDGFWNRQKAKKQAEDTAREFATVAAQPIRRTERRMYRLSAQSNMAEETDRQTEDAPVGTVPRLKTIAMVETADPRAGTTYCLCLVEAVP